MECTRLRGVPYGLYMLVQEGDNSRIMLKQRPRISENNAKKMILAMAKLSDHSNRNMTAPLNNKQIELWFEQNGYPFNKLLNTAREWRTTIPMVENLASSTFYIESSGSHIETSVIETSTGNIISSETNSSVISISDYQEKYRSALKSKERAMTQIDIQEYYACLSKSFSAFESYFHYKANEHNAKGSNILQDTKAAPVSLEEKFKSWIPIISGGNEMDLGREPWRLLKKYQAIRDNNAIHSKHISLSISYDEFALYLNEYRDGIAKIFYDLHIIFEDEMKAFMIKEVFSPDIYVELGKAR